MVEVSPQVSGKEGDRGQGMGGRPGEKPGDRLGWDSGYTVEDSTKLHTESITFLVSFERSGKSLKGCRLEG